MNKCEHDWIEDDLSEGEFDNFGQDISIPCKCYLCGATGKSWYIHSNYEEDE